MNKGQLYLTRKKFEDALKEYDAAINLDPKNPSPYGSKGYVQIRLGDKDKQYADAIKTLEYLTTKVDPTYAFGHYNLALARLAHAEIDARRRETERPRRFSTDWRLFYKEALLSQTSRSSDKLQEAPIKCLAYFGFGFLSFSPGFQPGDSG